MLKDERHSFRNASAESAAFSANFKRVTFRKESDRVGWERIGTDEVAKNVSAITLRIAFVFCDEAKRSALHSRKTTATWS